MGYMDHRPSPVESVEVTLNLLVFIGAAVKYVWDLEYLTTHEACQAAISKAKKNLELADAISDIEFISVDKAWRNKFQEHIEWCAIQGQERQAIFFSCIRDAAYNKDATSFNDAFIQLEYLKEIY